MPMRICRQSASQNPSSKAQHSGHASVAGEEQRERVEQIFNLPCQKLEIGVQPLIGLVHAVGGNTCESSR